MNIRELTPSDADAVAALEAVLFAGETPWSREVLLTQFAQPYTFYIGAFDDKGALLGYAGLAMLGPRNDPEFEIHTIGVAPEVQRRGVGRELMDQLVHLSLIHI